LREAADREAIWAGILSGAIDTVATDHVHRGLDAKAGGIWSASPGCPGLETLLPVLLTEGYHARGLDLARVVDLVSTRPAQIMGLAHRKGAIAPGLDADFAIIDLDGDWTLTLGDVRSSAGYSIYEGRRFRGRVLHTVVRGRMVLRDRTLQDDSIGTGRYVPRRLSAASA
jgi:dihydropyrimidinase